MRREIPPLSLESTLRRAGSLVVWALACGASGAAAQIYGPQGSAAAPGAIASPVTPRQFPEVTTGETVRQGLRFEPSVAVEETWTSNANFDRGVSERRSDWVTQLTPGFRVAGRGAHSSIEGSVFVPVFLYARTGSENNRAIPEVHLLGNVDALERHFVFDAGVDVTRQFVSPFGATPVSPVVNTVNEYTAQSYRLRPAFRGELGSAARYEVSDLNLWTRTSNAPESLTNAYTNELHAVTTRDPTPFGWTIDYDHAIVRFSDRPSQNTEIIRLQGDYAPDPQLQIAAIIGYEDDDYPGAHYSNAVYGGGVKWRPTERTSLDATWVHRFFGSSYNASFDHRTALTVWSLRVSRDVQSYPQQLLALGAGTEVNALLNRLFTSRFPDPLQRQVAVDQVVHNFDLPAVLPGSVNLFTDNVRVVTDLRAVAGFLGARNNVYVSVYRQNSKPIGFLAADVGSAFGLFGEVTQTGANMTWSSRLSPLLTLTGALNASRANGDVSGLPERTKNGYALLMLSSPLSRATDFHVGTRYQVVRSNQQPDAEEAAVFVGVVHRFY